jgi:hypothetical protein
MKISEIIKDCETVYRSFQKYGIKAELIIVSVDEHVFDIMRSSTELMKYAKCPVAFSLEPQLKKPYFDIDHIRFVRGS